MRHLLRIVLVGCLCLFVLRTGGLGQSDKVKKPPTGVITGGKQRPESPSEPSNDLQPMERDRLKRLNQERWKKLKEETDQLLTLATELKQQVDSSNEQMLSVSVVRTAEQIEKLAKSVKQKMRGY